jgi:lysozyme
MNLTIAAELCKRFEGFRSHVYICPAGVPTAGFGSTAYADGRRVTMEDPPISLEDAEVLLMHELQHRYASAVARLCPVLLTSEPRFNAIVSWTYNLGAGRLQTSTLRRKINAQDWDGVREQLMKWTRGGGRVLPGLVKRRAAEAALI